MFTQVVEHIWKLPRAYTRVARVERDVCVPADDGASLLTDIWWPTGDVPPPTLLMRSPYGRSGPFGELLGSIYARRGIRVLVQSCRGTFGSGGSFAPQFNERADGLATLRWLERQPWFDGRLAMSGPSYLGYVQWAIAADAGPSLRAICPHITMSNLAGYWYRGGSFALDDAIGWTALVSTQEGVRFPLLHALLRSTERKVRRHIDHLPIAEMDEQIIGRRVPFWRDFVNHASLEDPFWVPADHSRRVADIRVPVNMVTGWYDIFLPLQLADYRTLVAAGNSPHLLIGPWTHTDGAGMAHQVRETLATVTAHLCNKADGLREAKVRLHLMGAAQWQDFPSWPPPGFVARPWYLHAGGRLAMAPPASSAPDRYRYDPANPTPIVGGSFLSRGSGRRNQSNVEKRSDVHTYTSDPLLHDLDVIGDVEAQIFVSSSLEYFDVFVRLCDVDETGRSTNVCDGIERVDPRRWRRAEDGSFEIRVGLWPTAQRFRAGHRIRVQVSSGAHPRFIRNLGTGDPLATATAMRIADQAVHHEPGRPSAVFLPTVR
ncbi:MAG TPA: X-Pro dipeptidyl-peptidase [Deltaproteobacteria bacterium]|nr:X-Pro dipeptidyl-peptidase [Deltaproteobacteria bacterium]